jgi:hypothetical protein
MKFFRDKVVKKRILSLKGIEVILGGLIIFVAVSMSTLDPQLMGTGQGGAISIVTLGILIELFRVKYVKEVIISLNGYIMLIVGTLILIAVNHFSPDPNTMGQLQGAAATIWILGFFW